MTDQTLRVVVVGAGGMGALFGAILSDGGLDVTLVDTDSAHIDAIRRNGLHISGLGGDRYQQIAVENDVSKIEQADVVLVQCKGTSVDAASRQRTDGVHQLSKRSWQ
jgi:2-dehydropantoate 2-reductase